MKRATECINVDVPCEGTCVTRNGLYPVSKITAFENCDGKVDVGFVSRELSRSLHAGGKIRVEDLDVFCKTWLGMRKLLPVAGYDSRKAVAAELIQEAIAGLTVARANLTDFNS